MYLDPPPEDEPDIMQNSTNKEVNNQLLAYNKFKIRKSEEIDRLIVEGLQDKYKRRLTAAEDDGSESEADGDCALYNEAEDKRSSDRS